MIGDSRFFIDETVRTALQRRVWRRVLWGPKGCNQLSHLVAGQSQLVFLWIIKRSLQCAAETFSFGGVHVREHKRDRKFGWNTLANEDPDIVRPKISTT